ncbi:response regulator [Tardiphaga sp. vice352]|uniref:response regulator n=1 Tax=unclassified Tardiphaga TaxID=2631404 RepID=UPI0011639EC0|nr:MULTISPECIES: response regulator [unclassified Tardiphaga]QDM15229.1 response regulator [Tardiphaga sp. vice278]QDM25398.1 response regulator [Tardiphaga sp. vice304]QDM30608.1 response regulator [Tardiphaga sp. vice352]
MAQLVLSTEGDDVVGNSVELDELDLPSTAPKMLIADDDPTVVRALADRCTRMGFDVETATNGMQAMLKASRSKPDILLVDVSMPEVDGFSVCAHLLDPTRKPLHVVVVTGSRDFEVIERCEGFGAFYAHKGPTFWRELEGALAEIYPALASKIQHCGSHPAAAKIRTRPRVLLIDDDQDVRAFLASRLKKYGVETVCASDATQGYRMACREDPTVIVSDYFMPNGDAQHLLIRLRTTPATCNVPVIVVSGRHLGEVIKQGLRREICGRAGAAAIMQKSLDCQELFGMLQNFCGFELDARNIY